MNHTKMFKEEFIKGWHLTAVAGRIVEKGNMRIFNPPDLPQIGTKEATAAIERLLKNEQFQKLKQKFIEFSNKDIQLNPQKERRHTVKTAQLARGFAAFLAINSNFGRAMNDDAVSITIEEIKKLNICYPCEAIK